MALNPFVVEDMEDTAMVGMELLITILAITMTRTP